VRATPAPVIVPVQDKFPVLLNIVHPVVLTPPAISTSPVELLAILIIPAFAEFISSAGFAPVLRYSALACAETLLSQSPAAVLPVIYTSAPPATRISSVLSVFVLDR